MGFVTKIFYGGQNPCYDGSTLICVTLYLSQPMSKEMVANKFGFLYDFSRFRYIPYWSWLSGIAEFSYANDTNQINPNNILPHIHMHNLHNMDENELQNTINDVGNIPLNRSLPWWDIHIIQTNKQTIVCIRCDHCLGDGATLMKFLLPNLLSDSDGNAIEFNITPKKPAQLSCCTIFAVIINALWCVFTLFVKTADTFHAILFDMRAKFGNQSLMHKSVSAQTVEAIQNILNNDETIRNELNINDKHYISINDIVMSITAGAERNVLLLQETETEIIENGTYKSLLVIAKPFEMEEAETIQNGWILASVPFFINIENHIQRVIQTANVLAIIKNRYHLWTTFAFYENIGNLWIFAMKIISYRLSCTHSCHYSMLNFKPYKENNTFIFATDIKVTDIGIFVGDTIKTHVIEIFKMGNRLSLNIVCGNKGEKSTKQWFNQFNIVSNQLLQSLTLLQTTQSQQSIALSTDR